MEFLSSMRGIVSIKCNILSKKIWELCNKNGCWISAEHVPGFHSNVAIYIYPGHLTKILSENSLHFCFKVHCRGFSLLQTQVCLPHASHLNKQLSNYVSWYPDPKSVGVDAFNISLTKLKFYAFLLFNLVAKSISKIIQEKASGIMVIPWQLTQNWFLIMVQSLVVYPIILPQKKPTLTLLLHENKSHPLFPKPQLLAMPFIMKAMGNRDLPEEVMDIICLSWRDTITSRYEGVLKSQKNYCSQRDIDSLFTDVKNVLDFFHGMYKRGLRYSGICTARSAFSIAVTIPRYERVSNHLLIS